MPPILVAAFYRFTSLPDFAVHRDGLLALARDRDVRGTILLAAEGINGTIAGPPEGVAAVLGALRALPGCAGLEWKESFAAENPFRRMKVRLKKEIVTLGVPGLDPAASRERYVEPEDWNALIADPETVLIDTRNDYEVAIGTFEGAIDPQIESFSDFPDWFREFRRRHPLKKVAMFCTGGIRCEKSTAFLRAEGVEDVFHLRGGILKYLEVVPEEQSRWRGECFVFDGRVSVGHDLAPGAHDMCAACGWPVSAAGKSSPHYVEGVSCDHCHDLYSDEQKRGFAERQRQMALARGGRSA